MNPLIDRFPDALEVAGKAYPIDPQFRTGLLILLAYEDVALTDCERVRNLVDLLYLEVPDDLEAAARKACLFLDCGREPDAAGDDPDAGCLPRLYSFSKDAPYIYSGFRSAYGIDLEHAQLHWWKFCFLLGDLPEDSTFKQLICLRRRKAEGRLTREERAVWSRMRGILELPELPDAEKTAAECAFDRAFGLV